MGRQLAQLYYEPALGPRDLDSFDSAKFLPRRSFKKLKKRVPWHIDVPMGGSAFEKTNSIGTQGLESCIGVAIVAHGGKIIAHIKPLGYLEQIQTLTALAKHHEADLKGAIAYVRVRDTAGSQSPTTHARMDMAAAVKKALAELHIHTGVHTSPAGGTGVSGEMYISADGKKVFIDGKDYKV